MKVSSIPSAHTQRPSIDLQTVHDTLSYMHEDMARVPGLERVATSLEYALEEIAQAKLGATTASRPNFDAIPGLTAERPRVARFLPRR